MEAVHFGAGNIGRGFIGYLLTKSGYHVTFADISAPLVEDLNQFGRYHVETLGSVRKQEEISGICAIRTDDVETLERSVIRADLITLSIGANHLEQAGKALRPLLMARKEKNGAARLDIIACENALCATDILCKALKEPEDDEFNAYLSETVGFPNCAVDRIVPNAAVQKELPVDVAAEDFFEWDIESGKVRRNREIANVNYVENLAPYLERKLFMLNGAHAAVAYLGCRRGYRFVHEAMLDQSILKEVHGFHREALAALSKKHGLSVEELTKYADQLVRRFQNSYLQDELCRVGRDPIRKLSNRERLVSPLLLCEKYRLPDNSILKAIAAGYTFDRKEDAASVEMQKCISNLGIEGAVHKISGLDEKLAERVAKLYLLLQ
ncbi:mannitol-1-phosphate 5-dehydrogenase [Clostridium sp. W14A]|uniref:Mannitol-1-phosphate 5-dehydrogenase n=1 Tax=Caproicibacter fermentans TaxID=2576756 RepID=A0A7G8T9A6_9FIRM|nr:mannitol-1-phosphate 5-dehydrogenase [Caproicibacter fermentans]OCN01464.1 mannitol-1-phosphate 5-dehydrogenase [Clostridium sp. W14A]QNK40197.1 mannitol-1-phosphate 5-dehydrogenase [Caproicibacter fermentans]